MKLEVGQRAPDFTLEAHTGKEIKLSSFGGKTTLLAFYPKAWSGACTNMIPALQSEYDRFNALNVQVLGVSTDHIPSLTAWSESMDEIFFPLLSDFYPHGEVAKLFGNFHDEAGVAKRTIFIIDKFGIIQAIKEYAFDEVPDTEELVKIIQELEPGTDLTSVVPTYIDILELPKTGVVMYCNQWCPDCRTAQGWLNANNIEYTKIDVVKTPAARKHSKHLAGGELILPVFEIDGEVVVDFDEPAQEKLKELLCK